MPTHVLFVEANLQTTFPNRVLQMSLTCTNTIGGTNTVNVGDDFFVLEGFTLNSDILNVLPTGQLNFQQTDFNWIDQMPNLKSITNAGFLIATNTANGLYFAARDPVTGLEKPLDYFVNLTNGTLNNNGGVVIHSLNVQNGGQIASTNAYGPVSIDATNVALLPGGRITSRGGDVAITTGSLLVTNHPIIADRALSLSITNTLLAGTNGWLCADGFNLFVKPTTGDFNAVAVTSIAKDYAEVFHNWAGLDLGAVAAGFTNNAALGNLILDGGLFSRFTFQPVAAANAIYIDRLDLRNSATNTDLATNYTGVDIKPGFNIYYANAFAGATDISAALDGKYGVNGSAGGKFIRVIHSGGVYNRSFGGSTLGSLTGSTGLEVGLNVSSGNAVSWNSVAGALNNVYYKQALSDADWQLIQSFISTETGRTSIVNPVNSDGGFYKVEVNLLP